MSTAPVRDQTWRHRAACRGVSPEVADLFFPDAPHARGGRIVYDQRVRELCAGCPVQPACLDWALDTRQDYGYIGGTTPTDRQAMIPCYEGWCQHPAPCDRPSIWFGTWWQDAGRVEGGLVAAVALLALAVLTVAVVVAVVRIGGAW